MKFNVVATYFDKIEPEASRLKMTMLLSQLLNEAAPVEAGIICNFALGQLHPPYIATQFNIAEKNIIKVIAEVTGWNERKIKERKKDIGDLGAVIAEGIWQDQNDISIKEVYAALDVIEKITGEGSQEKKNNKLVALLRDLGPLSAKYVIRIILGKIRLGFSDMTIIDALSWMITGNKSLRSTIEHAYNICVDIGLVAELLKSKGVGAVEKMKVHVGVPIRPAAAERLATAESIFKKIGKCVAQPKFDGFRLQIHFSKQKSVSLLRFFSRNLTDMSHMFPDLAKEFENVQVKSVICEGEAIVFDPHSGNFLPFQETIKRKRKHGISEAIEEMPLRLFIFDLLYLDGVSLLQKSHEYRRGLLLDLFMEMKNDIVKPVEEKVIRNEHVLQEYFVQNVSVGLEGLVVKRPDAVYTPGKRNFNWIKLKRQSTGELSDTIDSVVLGYYYGSGKRAALGIGAFLVGIYNNKKDCFESIAKIGTGLSDKQWKEFKKKCDALALPVKPKEVVVHKDLYPDIWVEPNMVVLVVADEITLSPIHTAGKTDVDLGFALRFPRFLGYRPDKTIKEVTTLQEIKRLYKDQF